MSVSRLAARRFTSFVRSSSAAARRSSSVAAIGTSMAPTGSVAGGVVLPPAFGATTMMSSSSSSSSWTNTTTHPSTRNFSTATANAVSKPDMFCRQCEQTQDHTACITVGVCGKSAECATMQDALIHVIKSVSLWCVAARDSGLPGLDPLLVQANVWTVEAAFSTLTNVNFIEDRIADYIREGLILQEKLREALKGMESLITNLDVANLDGISKDSSMEDFETFGQSVSIPIRQAQMGNDDCFSLNEIGTYGLKGTCAYAAHTYQITGELDKDVMKSIHEVWAKLASPESDMGGLLENALNVGAINAKVMAMLDGAHAAKLGSPEPTQVLMTATEGKCILISGHDLVDLEELLKQTEGTGINVYTHGEMLPAHSYPGLKKYKHLVGNYGTAWQNQKFEFASFPGPIIVTTNCVLAPRKAYKNRLYTMNETGVQGAQHIGKDRDFSAVIAQAKGMKGFPRTITPPSYHTVGFNHRAVLPLAGEVIGAVQSGALSRIVLIGGCDGSQFDRSYFTDLAEELPSDTLILTLGCAKNRIIHSEKLLGAKLANGLPRVLDMGQCNDSYSAVVVATELAKALNCGVNDLPLSLALSHLEQKAAAVLLTLLHLGVKNIRLGPSLPAFITPAVLNVLVENYNLMPTTNVEDDIAAIMQGK